MGNLLYHWLWQDLYVPLWPNVLASGVVYVLVLVRLRALRRLHEEIRDIQARHHEEHMAALDLSTSGGLAAVMAEVRAAKTAAEAAHGAMQALGVAVKPRPARRGATDMQKTGGSKEAGA
jgi:hypothetical protein